MTKRTIGYLIAACAFTLVLLAGSVGFLASDTHAAAPPDAAHGQGSAPAGGVRPESATAPNQAAKPAQPQVSTWTDVAPFPTVTIDFTPGPQSLKLKRANAAGYAPNGKLYVLGGRAGADGEDISLRNIFEYSPGSPGTWTQKAALLDTSSPGERATANMAVVVLTNTGGVRIYAVGGNDINSNPSSSVRVYDPVADSLTSADNWPASPARVPGGYAVYNNKLYIFGGFSALGSGAVYGETWRFDPMAAPGSQWTQLTGVNLSLARGYIAGATLDGIIYAVGGDTWNSSTRQLIPQTIVERLDPSQANPVWTTVASLPSARGDGGAWAYNTGTGYEISGRLLVAGGGYPVPDAKAYIYSPPSDTWTAFPALNHATRNFGAAQLNGQLYAFGGYDFTNNVPAGANFNQRYDATGGVPTATNTPVSSPTATSTPFNTNYNVCSTTGTIDPGATLLTGSQCDDCINNLSLPFAYTLYDRSFNSVAVSSNGSLGFVQVDVNPAVSCLPDVAASYSIFGYWDDLALTGTGNGVYYSTTGTAPNRVFNIEWRGSRTRTGTGAVNFEIRLFEGQPQFEIVYGTVAGGGDTTTVGVQKDTGSLVTQYRCAGQAPTLSNGQKLLFTLSGGVCPTNTPTFTPTITPTRTNTPTNTFTVTGTPPTFTSTSTITRTPSPTNTPCGPASNYIITQSAGATVVAGSTDIGNHCDDCNTSITLPFPVTFYGVPFSSANVSSNGTLQYTSNNTAFSNACLPNNGLNDAILPLWDDLRTDGAGGGIFTSTSGSAPNRIFNIEWRATYFSGGGSLGFEVRLYEGQDKFDLIYGSGSLGDSATVGVQRGTGTALFTQFECNTPGTISTGLKLTFTQPPCGSPLPTNTPTRTSTPGGPTFTPTRTATFTNTAVITNTPTVTRTNTPGPVPTCGTGADYVIAQSTGAAIVPGTVDTGNHIDDGITNVTLPFAFALYGQSFTTANLSSNGNLQFSSGDTAFQNACLPAATLNNAIMPYWDDLRTDAQTGCSAFTSGCGVYTSVSGSAPNRIFNIEWRATYFGNTNQAANFELRLYESGGRFDFVYGAGAPGDGATVGVQNGTGPQNTQFECNTVSTTSSGLQLAFTQPLCATITPTATATVISTLQWRVFTPVPTGNNLRDVFMLSIDDGWVVGDNGTVLHWNGASWQPVNSGTTETLVDVFALAPNNVYALSWGNGVTGGHIYHYNGTSWTPEFTAPGNNDFYRIDGTAPNDLWAVGNGDMIVHWNGVTWGPVPSNAVNSPNWRAIDMVAGNDGWAVGQFGTIIHWNGTAWSQATSPESVTMLDVFMVSAGDGWSAGLSSPSYIDHYNGTSWTQASTNAEGYLRLYMLSSADGWAVASIAIGHHTGAGFAFSQVSNPTANTLNSIFMVNATEGWIVGANSTILHYSDSAAPTRTPTSTPTQILVGHVVWQGRPAQPDSLQQMPVTLTLKLGTNEVDYPSQATDPNGFFTVTLATLPDDTYDWRIKGPLYLANAGQVTLSGAPTTQVEMGLMRVGDCNDDNLVNSADFNIFRNTFGKQLGDPGYDPRADFNGDNMVSSADFNLLNLNFGSAGPPALGSGTR